VSVGAPRGSLDLAGRLALTIREAAAAVGVSERHLRAILSQVPHCRLGGRVVVPVEPFRGWLAEQAALEAAHAESEAQRVDRIANEALAEIRRSNANDR
jgi:hypothetical protein